MRTILIIVLVLLIAGGVAWFGFGRGKSSTRALREKLSTMLTEESPGGPAATAAEGKAAAEAPAGGSVQNQNTTVNIQLTGSAPAVASATPAAPATETTEAKAPAAETEPENPVTSWTTADKTNKPVEYMNAVLDYFRSRRQKLQDIRFEVGVSMHEWESRLEKSQKDVRASEAMLREAVKVYQAAVKDNAWPADFAYRDYTRPELEKKIAACYETLQKNQAEARRLSQGLKLLRDTTEKQERALAGLDDDIKLYTDKLELLRSGKLNANIEEYIQSFDKSLNDQRTLYEINQKQLEEQILMPALELESKVADNLDDILKQFGTQEN